jgi:2-keto-4-pentenoate hydratase
VPSIGAASAGGASAGATSAGGAVSVVASAGASSFWPQAASDSDIISAARMSFVFMWSSTPVASLVTMYITTNAEDSSSVNSATNSSAFQFRLKPLMTTSIHRTDYTMRRTLRASCRKMPLFTVFFVLVGCVATARIENDIENAWQSNSSIPLAHLVDETLTIERAYGVQKNLVRRKLQAEQPAGFKAGLTSEPSRKRFHADTAVAGVLINAPRVAPARFELSSLRGLYIETEVAMRIGKPITNKLSSIDELKLHIDGIAAAIELPNLDYQSPEQLNALDIVASNVAAAYFLTGTFASPAQRDPNTVTATLQCGGQPLNVGHGRDSMGDQWEAAMWLVNTMIEQGWTMHSGQILLTGALGKMIRAVEGRCSADFGDLGTLEFEIAK